MDLQQPRRDGKEHKRVIDSLKNDPYDPYPLQSRIDTVTCVCDRHGLQSERRKDGGAQNREPKDAEEYNDMLLSEEYGSDAEEEKERIHRDLNRSRTSLNEVDSMAVSDGGNW